MTGLRAWTRDGDLPARAGDVELAPPDEGELLELVQRHLLRPGAARPTHAEWIYARWKPGTSLCSAWTVALEDGRRALVAQKRYAGGKAATLAPRSARDAPDDEPLLSSVVLPDARAHLWTLRGDRELPGLARALDSRWVRRLISGQGLFPSLRIRSHRSQAVLVRYRPERRAVLRLELGLKDAAGVHSQEQLALRVRPPERARSIAARRRCLGSVPGIVPLVADDERTGLLLEPWLDVKAHAPDVFDHAEAAGALLGTLHAVPLPPAVGAWAADGSTGPWSDLLPLLSWSPRLARALRGFRVPSSPTVGLRWIHGDFHPDQVAREPSGAAWLLDLDRLAAGDPHLDLASWIADHLAAHGDVDFERAAEPLLAGYGATGGMAVRDERLRSLVAALLVRHAAAACRRLERGAFERAEHLLERARDLAPAGTVFT